MTRQQRKEREMVRRRRWYHFFRVLTVITFIGMALGAGFIGGLFASVAKVLPSGEELADINPPVPTRILASDGTLLAKIYNEKNHREVIPITRMKYMPTATLAIEDIRFYDHPGVDPQGIARAMVKNIISGNSKEGASTITQQLARTLYLSRQKKIVRKLQEVVLALELERRYSKQEILETYLNQVYYGANKYGVQSYGVQMAARNIFGKDVEKLTLAQSALLAGLPKNPRDYNPFKYQDAARSRRNTVLANMRKYNLINDAQYQQAITEPIKLAPEKKMQEMADYHAPYFIRYIQTVELRKIFGEDANNLVYHYGIDVYTSIDPRMQKVAEEAVTEQVQRNRFRHIDDGALVAIDPQTGNIKAMVGGTDFRRDQYNIVTQGHRQPGSAFKPFVYTTALLRGYTPRTRVYDRPGRYSTGAGGGVWSPKNSDGRFRGAMQLQQALWLSRNAAAAGVANDIGIQNIIQVAYAMGIKYKLEPYLTTSLGASVVVPMEICSGYGTLANGGIHHQPTGIVRVVAHTGDVLYEYSPHPTRAIPTEIANTMQTMMRGVIERGTAQAARTPFPASGKTGTTNSFRDAWFIGYTDDLVAAVWVGNRHNQAMNRTFGGTVPAPIWKQFMLTAQPVMAAEHREMSTYLASINNVPDSNNFNFKPSEYIINHGRDVVEDRRDRRAEAIVKPSSARDRSSILICPETHLRATAWCPNPITVRYASGRQPAPPSRFCNVHTGPESVPRSTNSARRHNAEAAGSNERGIVMTICAQTHKIATSKCPTVLRRRFDPADAPTETCPLHGD